MPLVHSTDCGEDTPSAQALLARHRDLEGQIRAYEGDIQSLNSQADRLIASGVTSLGNPKAPVENGRAEPDADWAEEVRLVPEEYSEDETFERTEYRTVTEERLVPQVNGIYAFEGQGMTMTKGEVRQARETGGSAIEGGFNLVIACTGHVLVEQNQRRLVARPQGDGQRRIRSGELRPRNRRQAHTCPGATTFRRQRRQASEEIAHGEEDVQGSQTKTTSTETAA